MPGLTLETHKSAFCLLVFRLLAWSSVRSCLRAMRNVSHGMSRADFDLSQCYIMVGICTESPCIIDWLYNFV